MIVAGEFPGMYPVASDRLPWNSRQITMTGIGFEKNGKIYVWS